MPELLKSLRLENGLKLSFFDCSNRYFGDFHRVCLEVKGEIAIKQLLLSEEIRQTAAKISDPLCFYQKLERMGVPTADLDRVKQSMVEAFLQSSSSYLARPSFPRQLLQKKLVEKPRQKFLLRR